MNYEHVCKKDIERLCRYIADDRYIAGYLKINPDRVRHVRKNMPKQQAIKRRSYESKLIVEGDGSSWQDICKRDMARRCDALLRRQFEKGQHVLNADGFHAMCREKGWM